MTSRILLTLGLLFAGLALTAEPLQYHVPHVAGTIAELGVFSAPAWEKVPALPFRSAGLEHPELTEGGTVKMLWNEDTLFLFADMVDSDLVQEEDKDGEHLYRFGDVLEIFIRPAGVRCYWEIYAAPNGRRSSFFYPSRGRRLPSCFTEPLMPGYQINVELRGTLNHPADRDQGWRCIAAIPMKALQAKAGKLDFSKPWLMQVARYNYSVYLDNTEFSQIGITVSKSPDYHQFKSWVEVFLDK